MKERIELISRNYVNLYLTNKLVLDKENSFKNIVIKINRRKINSSREDEKNFKSAVEDYLNTLNEKCKNFNPTLLIENFKKTNFDINMPLSKAKFLNEKEKNITYAGGMVAYHKDYISYYALLKSIYHELMHSSSSKMEGKTYLSGLSIRGGNVEYGVGINEAYTQYLTERYFKDKCNKAYRVETSIIKPLEVIVGRDDLEKCYFNADLKTVLNKLGKYSTEKEINSFVENFDELLKLDYSNINDNDNDKLTIKNLRIQELINKICLFYLNTLKNKIFTFDKYNLTSENVKDIMYLLDKSNWVKTIENKYYTLNQNIYEEVSYDIQEYLSFEEAKKIS